MATADTGEHLFESYVSERGYRILAYEPDLGTPKRPDYVVQAGSHEIVVEVKSFDSPITVPVTSPGGFTRGPDLDLIRNKINKAAAQLNGITGYPLMIVLANPRELPVPLAYDQVIAAMYGDQVVTIDEAGELQWRTGRNGRLRVNEPDDTRRGSHPYIGAVAVLHRAGTQDHRVARWLSEHESEYQNPLAAYTEALRQVGDGISHGVTVGLDVYETVSDEAVPVPRDVFTGPSDSRWGKIGHGRYGRLTRHAGND